MCEVSPHKVVDDSKVRIWHGYGKNTGWVRLDHANIHRFHYLDCSSRLVSSLIINLPNFIVSIDRNDPNCFCRTLVWSKKPCSWNQATTKLSSLSPYLLFWLLLGSYGFPDFPLASTRAISCVYMKPAVCRRRRRHKNP